MAIQSAFRIWNNEEAPFAADPQSIWFRQDIEAIVLGLKDTGVLTGGVTTAEGTPDRRVNVTSGTGYTAGSAVSWSTTDVTLTNADATLDRLDMIVVNASGTVTVRTGTAAAETDPADFTAGDILLAFVFLPHGTSTIITSYITDKRVFLPTRFANPTGTVGLAAVNGSATTYMRSDAAPALSVTIAPIWTGLHKWSATLGVTADDTAAGVYLITAGTAAAGAQQISPSVHWRGSGWKTTSVAAAQPVDFREYVLPIQGSVAPTVALVWETQVNGGGYTEMMRLNNGGNLLLANISLLSSTGVVNVTSGFQIGAAAASGHYLRGNATSYVDSVILAGDLPANGANPSASVGLAAVNGSATTWMRSDGAPALSQAIAPTWTATHIWSAAPIRMGGAGAYLSIISTSAPTNVTSGDLSVTRLHVGIDVAQVSQVHVAANGNATMRLHGADSTNAGGVFSFISQHGTIASPTATVNGDHIGSLIWRGWDGTTQQATASITVLASDSYTSSVFGSEMAFSLVSHGTNSLVTRLNLVAGGSQAVGYLNVANTAAVPANTTGGDLTSIRYFNTGGRIDMLNATSNVISWSTVGVNVPGASSVGQKLQLYGTPGSPAASDYALGIQSGAMWFTGGTFIWYNSSGVAKTELIPGSGLYHIGFVNVASSIANPSNTTIGDITAVRGHFGTDSAFGANEVLTVNGGIFEAYYNAPLVLPAPVSGFGFAVTWNFSNGSGEVDLWNTWPAGGGTGGFLFNSLNGASYLTHAVISNGTIRSFLTGTQVFWLGNGSGSLQWAGWGYCGDATGTPGNVNPGDFNCGRLFAGSAISTSGSISGGSISATSSFTSSVLGTFVHATGNYMIEYQGTGTGAITYGHYIDSSSQFHLDAVGIAQICLWTSAGDYQILGANAYKASGTTWTPISDARVKHVEEDFTDGLDIVEQFRPRWWTYNGNAPSAIVGTRHMGLVAQEIEKVTPYMVQRGKGKLGDEEVNDFRRYDGHAMDFILVNAVKELSARNRELEARLVQLEGKR